MVRVCEIEITNEHNDGKQKKKDRSRRNGKKATNSGREKKEKKKYSVFCQKFILPV